ncbi:MAG TPA: SH3 domain-containing protein [Spirochaetota bacterium]|nr:SH3 domain-containing protein [Spirochaetota bacterium]
MKKTLLITAVVSLFLITGHIDLTASGKMFIATKAGLRLRSAPDTSSKVVTVVPFGDQVTVIKEQGDGVFIDGRYGRWTNVSYGKKSGWVFSAFLAPFNPSPLIKQAAEFYRQKYGRSDAVVKYGYTYYTQFKDDAVSIKGILGDLIILEMPTSSVDSLPDMESGNVIWRYNAGSGQFAEVYDIGHANTSRLLYLDNDDHPDMIVAYGCCETVTYDVWLGTGNSFIKADTIEGYEGFPETSYGQCDKTVLSVSDVKRVTKTVMIKDNSINLEEDEIRNFYYRFNCQTRKLEKFAEGTTNEGFRGVVKSIDVKSGTMIVTDRDDDIDKSFIFFGNVHVSGSEKNLSLADIHPGLYVGLRYESINGKNIVHIIDYWGEDVKSNVSGTVLVVDESSGQLVLQVGRNARIYKLPVNPKFINSGFTIDKLRAGDTVKLYFESGKIVLLEKK